MQKYFIRTLTACLLVFDCGAKFQVHAQETAGPVVRVAQGQVRGLVNDDVASFKGIPFAAPPVGEARWRAPRPALPWSGVRDGTTAGPECMQPRSSRNMRPQSEDCLSVSVWKPATASAHSKLPVMFWIYGGGFTTGSNSSPAFDGTNLARHGVILVSINYRLGPLGFFAHPALTAEDPNGDLGNFGLMDAIAGLRWVKENIAAFGGDPNNVTIFGESAGGVLVDLLMTSPRTGHLFHKAIAQSSFASLHHEPIRGEMASSAENKGVAFATALGVAGRDDQTVSALRALPADRLISMANSGDIRGKLPPFSPMIDGKIVVERPSDAFAGGREAKVPFIIGGTSWEASLTPGINARPEQTLEKLGPARAATTNVYKGDPLTVTNLVKTDVAVTEPARKMARWHAAAGQRSYAFYFAYVPAERRSTSYGAPHGAEVSHMFGTLEYAAEARPGYAAIAITPKSRALSNAMITYWSNFAKTGEPGTVDDQTWLTIAPGDGFMVFDEAGPKFVPNFMKAKLDALGSAPDAVRHPIP